MYIYVQRGGSVNMNNNRRYEKRSLRTYVSSACKRLTRLFDLSNTSAIIRSLKNRFLCLSLRTLGVFFVTLGAYAFIITAILAFFTDRVADHSGIYGGPLCVICSLPLLFSKGNFATALINSRVGSFLCHQLAIRKESLPYEPVLNSLSVAFVAGIVVSLFTLVFPFSFVMTAIAVTVIVLTVLYSPEAGLTFFVAFLFFAGPALQHLALCSTAVSYALKLIRGKRTLVIRKTDLFLVIFALCSLGGLVSSSQEDVGAENLRFVFLLIVYLLCTCLVRDCRTIKNLMGFSVMTGGFVCSLFLLGHALCAIIPRDIAVDPAYLKNTVLSLPAFENGSAPLFFATLIPISIAFIMKPHSESSRLTVFLCSVSMLCTLIISENIAYTAAAVIASIVLMLIAGSRRLYFFLSLILGTTVITSFAGAFGENLYGYIFSNIKEAYSQTVTVISQGNGSLANEFLFCGQGFNENTTGSSFFYSIFNQLGICGSVILAILLIAVLLEAVSVILRTYNNSSFRESVGRFSTIADPAELRMGSVAMICSVVSLILCATFSDLYAVSSSYAWAFLICGACSAYSENASRAMDKAQSSICFENCREHSSVTLAKVPLTYNNSPRKD